jgi:ribonuclease E
MTKRMLIDATHAEETRVVVLDGNRLEDFDVETQSRKQLKGNIYLAKIVRVEPSLQAAFVEYGGNRHGFLAFSEIHPDYYQIPVADRQRLLAMQEEDARAEEEAEENGAPPPAFNGENAVEAAGGPIEDSAEPQSGSAAALDVEHATRYGALSETSSAEHENGAEGQDAAEIGADLAPESVEPAPSDTEAAETAGHAPAEHAPADEQLADETSADHGQSASEAADASETDLGSRVQEVPAANLAPPETIGGESDHAEEVRERRPSRFLRSYKIQEVIRRRQIILIQVVKEERGTKGAALTTYISLAGRYCVLMPNSPRGGGISRKITSATDRRRLKEVTAELEIPRGMGLIVRTAGANRPKPEIKRDCEYLLRLWDEIREQTLQSVAPSLIYEEASLIKRAIRDVYSRDVDEILVDGEEGWKAARDFMRMLMPTHVKKVQLWRDGGAPLFARQQVEAQLDAMLSPTVQLKSGGYLVINQAEALVAIDVNSGRSTRERGIEETAVRTNLEAADEVARQLRLRDLAGLIVIDFIDMESKKNNASVERRLKEALKNDRARIQVGHISHFGLMEMSRQRLRPSLAETSLTVCPHCAGMGHVRSTESAGLHVLRAIEEEGGKRRAAELLVHVPGAVAFYVLNHKRQLLMDIEARYAMKVSFGADETLAPANMRIDRLRAQITELPPVIASPPQARAQVDEEPEDAAADAEDAVAAADADDVPVPGETAEEGETRRRRRRRRRRGNKRDDVAAPLAEHPAPMAFDAEQPDVDVAGFPGARPLQAAPVVAQSADKSAPAIYSASDFGHVTSESSVTEKTAPARAPHSRGGRRPRRSGETEIATSPQVPPAPYAGPTPADPFGNVADIFDIIEQSVATATRIAMPPAPAPASSPAANGAAIAEQATEHFAATTTSAAEADLPAPAPSVEPFTGPVIQPVVIGATETAGEKKRGWWRR